MIEIYEIRIYENYPGVNGYVGMVRLQDEDKGYKIYNPEVGPVLEYDKYFSMADEDMDDLARRMGDKITEVLS